MLVSVGDNKSGVDCRRWFAMGTANMSTQIRLSIDRQTSLELSVIKIKLSTATIEPIKDRHQ